MNKKTFIVDWEQLFTNYFFTSTFNPCDASHDRNHFRRVTDTAKEIASREAEPTDPLILYKLFFAFSRVKFRAFKGLLELLMLLRSFLHIRFYIGNDLLDQWSNNLKHLVISVHLKFEDLLNFYLWNRDYKL